jgi:hypothetical protein
MNAFNFYFPWESITSLSHHQANPLCGAGLPGDVFIQYVQLRRMHGRGAWLAHELGKLKYYEDDDDDTAVYRVSLEIFGDCASRGACVL